MDLLKLQRNRAEVGATIPTAMIESRQSLEGNRL
jgi:hypothetical protein